MSPKGKQSDSTRNPTSAKAREQAIAKLAQKGADVDQSAAVGAALQRALKENA